MLTAHDISYAYPRQPAVLSGLSVEVCSGEVLAILGANGVGKSTLLRLLAGQLAPAVGEVCLNDARIDQMSRRRVAQQICYLPQFESIDSHLTIHEIVSLGRAPHRGWWLPLSQQDHAVIESALRRMQLVGLEQRPAATLSGGQWRRMLLARALAQQASVLLLDEPTNGLDLKYQWEFLNQIRELAHQQNVSVAISLHDLNLAATFADRIVLLCDGFILASGSPAEVITEQNIQRAYDVRASILPHPQGKTPVIIPIR